MRRTRARYGSRLAPGQASMLATLASIVVRRAIVRGAVRQFSLRCYARRRCRVLLAARVAMPPRARRTGAAPASEKSSAPARPQAPRPPQLTPARVCLALAVAALGSLSVAVKLAGSAYAQSLFAAFEPGLPLSVSRQTATLHAALFVFDLHCDASFSARCAAAPRGPRRTACFSRRSQRLANAPCRAAHAAPHTRIATHCARGGEQGPSAAGRHVSVQSLAL